MTGRLMNAARELYEAHHAALVPESGGTLPFVRWEALTPREKAGWEYAAATIARVRALWGGGEHPPVFLSDRPNKIVRATADRPDLGARVTESFLRVSDVRAALASTGGGSR